MTLFLRKHFKLVKKVVKITLFS